MAGYSGNGGYSDPPTVTMYHSTDAEGAKGIRRDRTIGESSSSNSKTKGDMIMGEGTYLHPYNPRHVPKEVIAWNNYDDGREVWGQELDKGKADYYVKVNVPKDRLERMPSNSREVYKYDGPIDLKEFGGRVYKVPDRNQPKKN